MSDMSEAIFNSKQSLPNKLLQEDGTITDIAGNPVTQSVDAYTNKSALPNKFLNPDGSYSSLNEILASMIDTELFIIVNELPASGEPNKIYLLIDGDKFIEYAWVNNKWDPIGMVEFDVSQYSTTDEMNTAIAASLVDAKNYANTNFLKKDNTTPYTPTTDYHPATKKYIDDIIKDMKLCNLGLFSDYPTDKELDLNKLSPGEYFLYKDADTFCVKAMYKGNKITGRYNFITGVSNRNLVIIEISQKINDDLTDGANVGNVVAFLFKEGNDSGIAYTSSVIKVYSNSISIGGSGATLRIEPVTRNYNQTITGVKTFSVLPKSSVVPTDDDHFVNKKYVDDSITINITNVLNGSY